MNGVAWMPEAFRSPREIQDSDMPRKDMWMATHHVACRLCGAMVTIVHGRGARRETHVIRGVFLRDDIGSPIWFAIVVDNCATMAVSIREYERCMLGSQRREDILASVVPCML